MTANPPARDCRPATISDRPLVITIDGPAGTGKSSAARFLAARLGLGYLDTGAMYRAAAAVVIDGGIDPRDEDAVVAAVAAAGIRLDWSADPPSLIAGGRRIDHRLRDEDVGSLVSPLSALPRLREHLVELQRRAARRYPGLVTEGRDQGTVVFPDAPLKFYLDATPRVRARRRALQLREAGRPGVEEDVYREILERDERDSSRAVAPLRPPEDAIRLDTSGLTLEQVVQELERCARTRLAGLPPYTGTR